MPDTSSALRTTAALVVSTSGAAPPPTSSRTSRLASALCEAGTYPGSGDARIEMCGDAAALLCAMWAPSQDRLVLHMPVSTDRQEEGGSG